MSEHIPTEDFEAAETPTSQDEAQQQAQERIERRTELAKEQEILGRNRTRTQSRRENILREQRPAGADVPESAQSSGDPITAEEWREGVGESGLVDRDRIDDSRFDQSGQAQTSTQTATAPTEQFSESDSPQDVRATAEDIGQDVIGGLTGAAGATGAAGGAIVDSVRGRTARDQQLTARDLRQQVPADTSAQDSQTQDSREVTTDQLPEDTAIVDGEVVAADQSDGPEMRDVGGEGEVVDVSGPNTISRRTRSTAPPPRPVSGGGSGFLDIGESIVPDSVERGLSSVAETGGAIGSDVASFTTTPIREATGEAVGFAGGDEQGAEQTFDRVVSGAGSAAGRTPAELTNTAIDVGEVTFGTAGAAASGDVGQVGETVNQASEIPGRAVVSTARQAQDNPLKTLGALSLSAGGSFGLTRVAPTAVRSTVSRAGSAVDRVGMPRQFRASGRFRGDTSGRLTLASRDRSQTAGESVDIDDLPDQIAGTQPNPSPRTVGGGSRSGRRGRGGGSTQPSGGRSRGTGSRRGRDRSLNVDTDIDAQSTSTGIGEPTQLDTFATVGVGSAPGLQFNRLERAQTPTLEQPETGITGAEEDTTVDTTTNNRRDTDGGTTGSVVSGSIARLETAQQSEVTTSTDVDTGAAAGTALEPDIDAGTRDRTGIFAGTRTDTTPAQTGDSDLALTTPAAAGDSTPTTPTVAGGPAGPTGGGGGPTRPPRLFGDDEPRRRRETRPQQNAPTVGATSTGDLGTGWLSETFTGFAIGPFAADTPSQSTLGRQPGSLFATGELPTETLLSDDPETQARLEAVGETFAFGTLNLGGGR